MTRRPSTTTSRPDKATGVLSRSYKRSDGTKRRVVIGVDETDCWLVYDIPSGAGGDPDGQLVEHLIGYDERLGQALALATEYLRCQTAFHAGERKEMPCPNPLPKPEKAPLALIRRLGGRARRAIQREHSQQPAEQLAA